jgi:hypothetical protein
MSPAAAPPTAKASRARLLPIRRARSSSTTARGSTESREQHAAPDHEARAKEKDDQRCGDHGDPSAEVRLRRRRRAARCQARRAIPDAVPLRRALLAERFRALHADGEGRPLLMNRTPPGRGPIHSISHSGAAEFSSIVDTRRAPAYPRASHESHRPALRVLLRLLHVSVGTLRPARRGAG